MKSLLDVEVRRFRSRRAMRVMAGAALLGIAVAASLTFAFSNRNIAAATSRARAQAMSEYQGCLRDTGGDAVKCEEPDLASISGDPRFHLSELPDVLTNLSGLLVVIGLAAGATFIGAEWHHRTMTVELTWEPRRVRVAAAKVGAAAGMVFLAAVAVQAILSAALVPAAIFRGTTEGVTVDWLLRTTNIGLRGAALAGFTATVGSSLALAVRNTAFAVGASFVWTGVIEGFIRQGKPGWSRWLIGDNAAGFIAGGPEAPRTGLASGILLAVYAAVVVAVATRAFGRRDVA